MEKPKMGPWRAHIKILCEFVRLCVYALVFAFVCLCAEYTGPEERLLNSISAGRTKEDGWRIPSQR